ncbi:MAG: anti-sigma factor family protein [Bryobacteraceae bacterium]
MNCADAEILICDWVDGTLAGPARAELDRHLAACPACAELARDSAAASRFLATVEPVEPPPALVNRLLFQAPLSQPKSRARQWLEALLSPILQPRYVMSAAMTILVFATLARFVTPARIRPADLRPSAIWAGLEDRAYRTWGRAEKFYDNLKVVYQIQSTLREWQQRDDDQTPAPPAASAPALDEHQLRVHPPANRVEGEPR